MPRTHVKPLPPSPTASAAVDARSPRKPTIAEAVDRHFASVERRRARALDAAIRQIRNQVRDDPSLGFVAVFVRAGEGVSA